MHEAARNRQKEVSEVLIAKGADINAKDNHGRTALRFAIGRNHDAVAEVLRKAGAKE